eukprot:TRINITY_DN14802_c0_g1_i4.p1 TRINITY_DN14802_c0_g1~~TRINITY_DN14802_c0_g1_i4.p1  ORF type:complete len:286 (+),score=22.14 TRINITY_DN14802_c0_g1_i4:258-1115(+)
MKKKKKFLSEEECAHIIRLATTQLKRSTVVGDKDGGNVDAIRTSYGMFIPRYYDPVITTVEEKLANWTHLPISYQEDIQVLRYQYGQKYGAHYDALGRIATVLVYLTDVEEGGETAFPVDSVWAAPSQQKHQSSFSSCAAGHVAVKPKKGDALLFYSLKPDGQSQDVASMHTGCPIIQGIKYTATIWIHPEDFRLEWLQEKPKPLIDPGICVDMHELCEGWASSGECDNNPGYMIGSSSNLGNCRKSCRVCQECNKDDRQCYQRNRQKEGYLSLDDELQLLGISV